MAIGRFSNIIIISIIVFGLLLLLTLIPVSPTIITGAVTFNDEIVRYNPVDPPSEGTIPLNITLKSNSIIELGEPNLINISIRPKGNSLVTDVNFTLIDTAFFIRGTNGTSLDNSLWAFTNFTGEKVHWYNTTSSGLFNNATNETFYVNTSATGSDDSQFTIFVLVTFNNSDLGDIVTNTTSITLQFNDTKPPTIINNTATGRVSGVIQINVTANDTGTGVKNVTFRYENSTINGTWTNMTNLNGLLWNGTLNTSALADGSYNIRINATDNALDENLNSMPNSGLTLIEGFTIQNAGANGGLGANISIVSPQNYTWHRSNFLTNVSLNDTANTVTNLSYRYENSTVNGSWIILGNLTGLLWNNTFNVSTVGDGNYTLRFNVTVGSNSNATIIETIFIDKIAPLITSFYTKKPVVLTGETLIAQDFVCVAIDNGTLIGGNFNYVITGFSTSDAGIRTATCTVTDSAQNIASALVNYTVKLLDQQIGGPTFGSATRIFGEVRKDGFYLFNDLNDDIGIYSIEFISKIDASNVNVKAEHLAPLDLQNKKIPTLIADVYLFVELSLLGLTDKDITDIVVKFSVTKEWLMQHGLTKEDVVLLRYDEINSQWWPIEVELTSEEDFHFNYKATIPEFTIFAIGSNLQGTEQPQQSQVVTQSISENVNRASQNFLSFLTGRVAGFQLNTSSPSRLANILVVLGALIALVLIYMRAFEGKSKKRFEI